MNYFAVIITFLGQAADPSPIAELFDVLDRDGNGSVTAAEISDAQKPFFQRALRVSDRNEDGALTREELMAAVKDPEPVAASTTSQRRPGSIELAQFDRNKDGKISKSELPEPLQQRFQQAIDQYGQEAIPIEVLRRMAAGGQTSPGSDRANSDAKKPEMEMTMSNERRQILEAAKRLDTNQDGTLSAAELKQNPGLARALDRNRDGTVSPSELPSMQDQPEISPRGKSSVSTPERDRKRSSAEQPPTAASAAEIFDRLDANKDGKLSRSEIPERMRSNIDRIDSDGDKSVSRTEFAQAVKRQEERNK